MKLIYLQWADATSPENIWMTEDEAKKWAKDDSYWIEQIGWLLEENKKYILIAGSKSTIKTDESILQYGHLQKIPITWIRNRKIIKL